MIVCPSCAADNAGTARFCNQCGARLTIAAPAAAAARPTYTPQHLIDRVLKDRAALHGERKRVTVLFCDIKGSTALAQQARAEAWHQVLDRFFSILGGAVHRFEGTVNQYTGDGIMALFGAPVAHEDHAIRACLAALEMQAAVRNFADGLRLERGLTLSMRVGLNTGEVIVGTIGDDLRMDYTAQGPTVNLAARLEQLCEPGRVLLSRATAALVEGHFNLRGLGAPRHMIRDTAGLGGMWGDSPRNNDLHGKRRVSARHMV